MRSLLKTAKKKLRDQDVGLSPRSSLQAEQGRSTQGEDGFGRMHDKVSEGLSTSHKPT